MAGKSPPLERTLLKRTENVKPQLHELCFVVEQNRDAQLHSLLILETGIPKDRLRPVLVYGGFPLSARKVIEGILTHSEIDERTGRLMPVVRDLEETTCPR